MKWVLVFISLLLFGCGDVVKDSKDKTATDLVGLWDLVQNTPTKCYERLSINDDSTFWWHNGLRKETDIGTWALENSNLNFKYTGRPWEIVKFTVESRELSLVQMGNFKNFVRVPTKGYTSACPF